MIKNKKWLFILPIIVLLAIPIYGFAKFEIDCQQQYNSAHNQKQPQIQEFDHIALLGEQPPQKAKVVRGGDCIDSKPYVTVSKSYATHTSGGQAVDSIRSSLAAAGYAITQENFGQEGCKDLYRVQAKKQSIKIYVVAYQKKLKDTSCTDGYPKGITESYFRSQTIDATNLTLR